MKQFIRYLYEYQGGQRIRNVGFVKVEQKDSSTVVHIHGRGLHLTGERTLKIYLFYRKGKECIGIWQGDAEHVNPAVNYRLTFTKEDTGRPENYPLIEGIILENAGGRRFAAVWNDMPVAVDQMRLWKKEPEPDVLGMVEQQVRSRGDENMEDTEPEEKTQDMETTEAQGGESEAEKSREDENGEETKPEKKEPQETGGSCYIKIQRQDISQLRRCEWRLANNSFLLHGYYNYHHLLLIEEKGQCWLGVPGIYHPREAQAAEAFGFPRFVKVGENAIEWEAEEKNDNDDFGYWCRQVRR